MPHGRPGAGTGPRGHPAGHACSNNMDSAPCNKRTGSQSTATLVATEGPPTPPATTHGQEKQANIRLLRASVPGALVIGSDRHAFPWAPPTGCASAGREAPAPACLVGDWHSAGGRVGAVARHSVGGGGAARAAVTGRVDKRRTPPPSSSPGEPGDRWLARLGAGVTPQPRARSARRARTGRTRQGTRRWARAACRPGHRAPRACPRRTSAQAARTRRSATPGSTP